MFNGLNMERNVLALLLVWRWALGQEFTFGERLVARCAMVCRSWFKASHSPTLLEGLLRAISIDIGTKNFTLWCGSLMLPRPGRSDEELLEMVEKMKVSNNWPKYVIHGWELIDLGSGRAFEACYNALHCFTSDHRWLTPRFYNKIYIESQPCLHAAQMQIVSGAVFAYFHTLALQEPACAASNRGLVEVITARKKLDGLWVGQVPNPPRPSTGTKASNYRYRKQLAVAVTRAKLDLYPGSKAWSLWFESLEKQDDAADGMTQALKRFIKVIADLAKEAEKKKRASSKVARKRAKRPKNK